MNNYKLPYFDNIDLDLVKEYYDAEFYYHDHAIQLDLNFDEESATKQSLDAVKQFIENIDVHIKQALVAIRKDFYTADTVKDYIEHHLEDIPTNELTELLVDSDKAMSINEQLLSKLTLERIGFYPEANSNFAVFDHTISRDITQYLIVVNINNKGNIIDVIMES